jgi:hypothetical protein
VAPNEFSAPSAARNAFPGLAAADEGQSPADPGFLGKAVGKIHKNLKYWEETLDHNSYVMNILKYGYKIPVKMTAEQWATVYREGNNKSACSEMDFVRSEVERLVADGQVIEVKSPVTCTNPLTVAFKVNSDGTIKRSLVIDLSRWVNPMIVQDKFRMSRFQDALAQSSRGDYQSVFDISKAYHHIRLAPESYCLVGFCAEDKDKKERFYHFVVLFSAWARPVKFWEEL